MPKHFYVSAHENEKSQSFALELSPMIFRPKSTLNSGKSEHKQKRNQEKLVHKQH